MPILFFVLRHEAVKGFLNLFDKASENSICEYPLQRGRSGVINWRMRARNSNGRPGTCSCCLKTFTPPPEPHDSVAGSCFFAERQSAVDWFWTFSWSRIVGRSRQGDVEYGRNRFPVTQASRAGRATKANNRGIETDNYWYGYSPLGRISQEMLIAAGLNTWLRFVPNW